MRVHRELRTHRPSTDEPWLPPREQIAIAVPDPTGVRARDVSRAFVRERQQLLSDELRQYFRVRRRDDRHVSLAEQRQLFLTRWRALISELAAA